MQTREFYSLKTPQEVEYLQNRKIRKSKYSKTWINPKISKKSPKIQTLSSFKILRDQRFENLKRKVRRLEVQKFLRQGNSKDTKEIRKFKKNFTFQSRKNKVLSKESPKKFDNFQQFSKSGKKKIEKRTLKIFVSLRKI